MDTSDSAQISSDIKTAAQLLTLYHTKVRDFADSDVSHANLRSTCFSYSNFRRSNLRHINWCNANLRGIDLSDTNLSRSNFEKADLRGAALDNALLFLGSLNGADLRGADLSDASLDLTTLVDANLEGANLCGTYLRGIDLGAVQLKGAYFDDRTQFDKGFDPVSAGMRTEIALTTDDVLGYLNQILKSATRYLGQSAAIACLEESRFKNRYLALFVVNSSGTVGYIDDQAITITFTHLKWLQLWTNQFVRNIALQSAEFPYVIDPNQLLVRNYEPPQTLDGDRDTNQADDSAAIFGPSPLGMVSSLSDAALNAVAKPTAAMAAVERIEQIETASSEVDPQDASEIAREPVAQTASSAASSTPIVTTAEPTIPPQAKRSKYNHYRFDEFFTLDRKGGEIQDWYGSRQIFAGEEFIVALMQGFDQEVGLAAPMMMYELGKAWGEKDFAIFTQRFESEFSEGITGRPLAFVLEAWWWPFTTQGWGTWEVNLETQENGFFFINIFDSVVARTLGDVGKPVCHLYAGLFAGFFSQLVQQELNCIELQCYAAGDAYCKFLLGKQQQVDAATFWQTEGAASRDIQARLLDGAYLA